jgi:beta-aspartyl-peptidase (threonine type)
MLRHCRYCLLTLTSQLFLFMFLACPLIAQPVPAHKVAIVIHGGAGTIRKSNMTPAKEQEYRDKMAEAINAGYALLRNRGTAVDAVEAAIRVMEDSPLFNAGKGAVFTHEGTNELDASVMEGKTLKAGAVTGVQHIKNPISLARMVMERSKHVMFTGAGAEAFARSQGMDTVPVGYFFTQRRWDDLQRAKKAQKDSSHGTVGCVALDEYGTIAAGTSTGGMTDKMMGRVGDSPIIGAGTYADNRTCGVSATGDGEYFIRATFARTIAALMAYGNLPLQRAADSAVAIVGALGGTGGAIALDHDGHVAYSFNTEGMYRAYIDGEGKAVVEIYKDN